MRVLHVLPSVSERTGGPAVTVLESCRALSEIGVESAVYATDVARAASARRQRPIADDELPAGADCVRVFPMRTPRRLVYSPALERALRRDLPAFDVVHIHSLYLHPQYAAFRAACAHRRPYVVSPRGALDPFLRRRGRLRKAMTEAAWQGRMLRGASTLHLTSADEARLVEDVAPLVPRAVVPNGIQWSEWQDLPSRAEFAARLGGHDGPIVMYLGRVSFKKGIDRLIGAFALVARERDDALLAIVGPDDEGLTPALTRLADKVGVGGRVHFVGMVAGEQRRAAMAAADVWVLPSHTENFGVAAVEALAAGRAVIVSPAVNIASDLAAADAAIVCESEPPILAAAIDSLLDDDGRRAVLAEGARQHARRYDWSNVAVQLCAMYESVAEAVM